LRVAIVRISSGVMETIFGSPRASLPLER